MQFELEDYELTQTSLEAIFCKFALAQQDEDDRNAAAVRRKRTAGPGAQYARVSADPLAMQELHAVETGSDDDGDEENPLALGYDAQQSMDLPPDLDLSDTP